VPSGSPTRLLIYASAALQRAAWRALLSDQPDISLAGELTEPARLALLLLQPDQPNTLLVDLPAPQPNLIQHFRDVSPKFGLLVLVQSYDLSEIIPLLKAGATGCLSRDETVGNLARAIIAPDVARSSCRPRLRCRH